MAYGNVDDLVRTRDAGDVLAAADRAAELADSGWTAMPFGVHDYVAPAVERGLKLSPGVQPWRWKDRQFPKAALIVLRSGEGVPLGYTIVDARYNLNYAADNSIAYTEPVCDVLYARGGNIDLHCETETAQRLLIHENSAPGWRASINGYRADLLDQPELALLLPPGSNTVSLRYRPTTALWSFWAFLAGLIILIAICPPKQKAPPPQEEAVPVAEPGPDQSSS